ncbi:hypothetical protein V2605_03540 [Tenacibaculum maritimum]|nr:hypothetical protein [Tenacibaculum maritimum]CAA0254319.1 hypothetical protein DPIF8902391_90070 [Tenacibaculum maritimum]
MGAKKEFKKSRTKEEHLKMMIPQKSKLQLVYEAVDLRLKKQAYRIL